MSIHRLDPFRVVIHRSFQAGMRVEGLVYADADLFSAIERDETLQQVANVATLPGIIGRSLAMPDAHQGYGFAIGGVAAMDMDDGVVSAGGVGFDINCGVRLLRTDLKEREVRPQIDALLHRLSREIPCGAGKEGSVALSEEKMNSVLLGGARWAVEQGYGIQEDLDHIEEGGCLAGADPGGVSKRARERGRDQLGTLGSGNHFAEVQYVSEVHDADAARAFHLQEGQVTVMIHSGSRGLGHQVCTDHLETMQDAMTGYGIRVIDRQLACVPIRSREGQRYLGAMNAAANYAFANRQVMSHRVRCAFADRFGGCSVQTLYDVAHNIAKVEVHEIEGRRKNVLVHRKGATRAFPAGHADVPSDYRSVGQPVLIPGSMGTSSYVLVGTTRAMQETFGSACHGAGRSMSRHAAKKDTTAEEVIRALESRGIHVRSATKSGLTEEKPEAYKDVTRVVRIVHEAGIARMVARLVPIGVIKG